MGFIEEIRMLTQEARPKRFDSMVGQPLVKKTLKAIVREPNKAPRSLIFEGSWGCGKTTAARIFSRALNCQDSVNHEPCLTCPSCKEDLDSSPFYNEYDAAIVGNVERTRELRDTFYVAMSSGFRVIVFDECHMASSAAQNSLLKSIEEVPPSVFFIFATTEVDRIIPTIRSRSLELRFDPIPHDEIVGNLRTILQQHNRMASDRVLNVIAFRSRGHMRNAHMYLDNLLMIGEGDFLESVRSAQEDFLLFFQAIALKDKIAAFKALDILGTYPLADLRADFQQTCLDMVKCLVGYKNDNGRLSDTVKSLGSDTLKLVKLSVSDWVMNSFDTDPSFQACMLCLFQLLSGQSSPGSQAQSLMARAGKR